MKRVIIIGADFVPSSLPPATRIRFFSGHLPEFGWEPIIVSTQPAYYEWSVDPESERLLPESLEVIKTTAIRADWTRRLGIGDLGLRTLWHHWQVLKKLCRERKIDLIFIPVPPYLPMVLGRLAHLRFGIPYVIDYIDPWVTEYYWKMPKNQRPPMWPLMYALSRTLEPVAIGKVAHITGVSQGVTDSVVTRYERLSSAHATEIPYGGEPRDFDYVAANPRKNSIFDREDGLFHMSYLGACIPGMYATIRALFKAVRLGLEQTPDLFSKLRLHFVGTTYAPRGEDKHQVLALADEAGIGQIVDEHPQRVSYLDSLQMMRDSHALVIFGFDEQSYAASKIYPYVLARRPLLAIVHEASSPATILKEIHASELVTFREGDPLAEKFPDINRKMARILSLPANFEPPTNWEAFEPYTTRAMAGRLAAAFEKALTRDSHTVESNSSLSLPVSGMTTKSRGEYS